MTLPPGVYPAAVTPFDERGRVDMAGVARLLAHFRAEGCRGVVLAGTNGEGPSLTAVEKRDFVKAAVPLASGMPVVLGIATASLEEAAWLGRQAADAGAAGTLQMPPLFYPQLDDEAVEAWFRTLLDRSPLPMLLYNFPQRAGTAISSEVVRRLTDHPKMLGVKDSSGDRANLAAYAEAAPGKALFVGAEPLLTDALAAGWTGTISGAANSLPNWLAAIVEDWDERRESAYAKAELIRPALEALRRASQPAAHKAVLVAEGVLPSAAVRLPLRATTLDKLPEIKEVLGRIKKI